MNKNKMIIYVGICNAKKHDVLIIDVVLIFDKKVRCGMLYVQMRRAAVLVCTFADIGIQFYIYIRIRVSGIYVSLLSIDSHFA